MGRSTDPSSSDYQVDNKGVGGDYSAELPEHKAVVDSFALDKYEVTVGRFRQFVRAYDSWHVADGNPKLGAGAHPLISKTGWAQSWVPGDPPAFALPEDAAALREALKCSEVSQNWTDQPGPNEAYAINCVNWFEAFAFCIWDGGRLPTEAEWECAAAGGDENRLYPWGAAQPTGMDMVNATLPGQDPSLPTPRIEVGRAQAGAGRWGHLDLSGGMMEWVFDASTLNFYGDGRRPLVCENCVNPTYSFPDRMTRGGFWAGSIVFLRSAFRMAQWPVESTTDYDWPDLSVQKPVAIYGFRCARSPKEQG